MPEDATLARAAAARVRASDAPLPFIRSHRGIEAALLGLILCGFAGCLLFLGRNGYLPPPFLYYAEDTFMDWFNTAYWANHGHQYDTWGTIYPPLSFFILKMFSQGSCYARDAFLARDCDWVGPASIGTLFVVNAVISYACFRARDRNTSLTRAAALTFSFPMLLAVERGNLILLTFTCWALAYGNLLRPALARWIALALAINLKPYVMLALVPDVIQRRWSWIEGCVVTVLVVYLLSFLFVGSGTPGQILLNELIWSAGKAYSGFAGAELASSYSSLFSYIARSAEVRRAIGLEMSAVLTLILKILVWGAQLGALITLALVAARRTPVPSYRLAALTICLLLTTIDLGLYTDVLIIFLIFLEPWSRPSIIVALVAAYLLCVPADHIWIHLGERIQLSYLTGQLVQIPVSLTVGSFVRPGLLLTILYALVVATLQDVLQGGVGTRDPKPSAVALPSACELAK